MRRNTLLGYATAALVVLGVGAPPAADAQSVIGKVKRAAKQKVDDQKRRTEQGIVNEAVEPLDSTLAKGARPVEGAVARTTAHADSAVSRTERAVVASIKGEPREVRRISAALHEGRFVLDRIAFVDSTAQLDATSEQQLAALAEALSKVPGTFLLQAHVAPGGKGNGPQRLAERRAAAVKEWLIAAGIPAERLFGVGSAAAQRPERIEVVKVN